MTRRVRVVERPDQINDTADDTNRLRRISNVSIVHHNYKPFVVQFYLSDAVASRQASYNEVSSNKRKRPRASATTDGDGVADGDHPASKRPTPPHNPQSNTTSHDDLMNHADSMFGDYSGNPTDQHFIMALVHNEKQSMSARMLDTLRGLFSRRDSAESETDEAGTDVPRPIRFDRSDHFSRQGGQYNEGYDRPIGDRNGQWEFASYGLGFGKEAGSAEAYAKLSYGNQDHFPDVEFPTPQQLYDLGIPWSRDPKNLAWVPDDERKKLMGRRLPRHLTYRYRIRDEEAAQVVGGGKDREKTGTAGDGSGGGSAGDVALQNGATNADGPSNHPDSSGAAASGGAAAGQDVGLSKVIDREDVDEDFRASAVSDPEDVDEDKTPAERAAEPVAPDSRAQTTKTAPHQRPGTRSGSMALGAQQDASAQSQQGSEQAEKRKPSWHYAKDPKEGAPNQPIGVDRRPEDNPGAVLDHKRAPKPREMFDGVLVQQNLPQRNGRGQTESSVSFAGGKPAAVQSKGGRTGKLPAATNKVTRATAGNTSTAKPRRESRATRACSNEQNVHQQRTNTRSTKKEARQRIHQIIIDRLEWWADQKGEKTWDDVQLQKDLFDKSRNRQRMPADYEPDRLREYLMEVKKESLVQLIPADPAWQVWRPTATESSVPAASQQPPRTAASAEETSGGDIEAQVLEMLAQLARARPSSRRTTVDDIMERVRRVKIQLDQEAIVSVLRRLQAKGLVSVYGQPAASVVLTAGSTPASRPARVDVPPRGAVGAPKHGQGSDKGEQVEDEEGDEQDDDEEESE